MPSDKVCGSVGHDRLAVVASQDPKLPGNHPVTKDSARDDHGGHVDVSSDPLIIAARFINRPDGTALATIVEQKSRNTLGSAGHSHSVALSYPFSEHSPEESPHTTRRRSTASRSMCTVLPLFEHERSIQRNSLPNLELSAEPRTMHNDLPSQNIEHASADSVQAPQARQKQLGAESSTKRTSYRFLLLQRWNKFIHSIERAASRAEVSHSSLVPRRALMPPDVGKAYWQVSGQPETIICEVSSPSEPNPDAIEGKPRKEKEQSSSTESKSKEHRLSLFPPTLPPQLPQRIGQSVPILYPHFGTSVSSSIQEYLLPWNLERKSDGGRSTNTPIANRSDHSGSSVPLAANKIILPVFNSFSKHARDTTSEDNSFKTCDNRCKQTTASEKQAGTAVLEQPVQFAGRYDSVCVRDHDRRRDTRGHLVGTNPKERITTFHSAALPVLLPIAAAEGIVRSIDRPIYKSEQPRREDQGQTYRASNMGSFHRGIDSSDLYATLHDRIHGVSISQTGKQEHVPSGKENLHKKDKASIHHRNDVEPRSAVTKIAKNMSDGLTHLHLDGGGDHLRQLEPIPTEATIGRYPDQGGDFESRAGKKVSKVLRSCFCQSQRGAETGNRTLDEGDESSRRASVNRARTAP